MVGLGCHSLFTMKVKELKKLLEEKKPDDIVWVKDYSLSRYSKLEEDDLQFSWLEPD